MRAESTRLQNSASACILQTSPVVSCNERNVVEQMHLGVLLREVPSLRAAGQSVVEPKARPD